MSGFLAASKLTKNFAPKKPPARRPVPPEPALISHVHEDEDESQSERTTPQSRNPFDKRSSLEPSHSTASSRANRETVAATRSIQTRPNADTELSVPTVPEEQARAGAPSLQSTTRHQSAEAQARFAAAPLPSAASHSNPEQPGSCLPPLGSEKQQSSSGLSLHQRPQDRQPRENDSAEPPALPRRIQPDQSSNAASRAKSQNSPSQLWTRRITRSAKTVTQPQSADGNESRSEGTASISPPSNNVSNRATSHTAQTVPQGRRKNKRSLGTDALHETSTDAEVQVVSGQSRPGETLTTQKSRPRKRKPRPTASAQQNDLVGEQDTGSGLVDQTTTEPSKSRRKRRKLTPTSEDSEGEDVDPTGTRMLDLCDDSRRGKISSLEQELREMDRSNAQREARDELNALMGEADGVQDQDVPGTQDEEHPAAQASVPPPLPTAPRTIIRDGQIVLDENAGQIDRHANAAAEREKNKLPPIEESSRTKRVTSGTWRKKQSNGGWNADMLDRFYQGLRMFGTDFEMISRMFPGKSRRAIKLKFVKEERANYARIKATLLGETVPVILEDYENLSGKTYNDTAHYEQELANDRTRLEEEQEVQTQLMNEATAERERQAAEERATTDEQSGNDSSTSSKKKKKQSSKGKKEKSQTPKGKHRSATPNKVATAENE